MVCVSGCVCKRVCACICVCGVCVCIHFDYPCILWQTLTLSPFWLLSTMLRWTRRCKYIFDPDFILFGCAPGRGSGRNSAFGFLRILLTLHLSFSRKSRVSVCMKQGSHFGVTVISKHLPFLPYPPQSRSLRWASHSYCINSLGISDSSLFQSKVRIPGPKMAAQNLLTSKTTKTARNSMKKEEQVNSLV